MKKDMLKKEIFKVSLGASLGVLLFTEIGIMIKFFKGFNWIIFLVNNLLFVVCSIYLFR